MHFAIETARRHDWRFAVLFIDLDRFKIINDSLGHEAGDSLLVEIANRLRSSLRACDVIARLGGDEFMVILEGTAESDDIEDVTRNLLSVLAQPLLLSGLECHTTASIGIAIYPNDGADVQTLTRNADMAMYLAKEDDKNGFRFFSKQIKTQLIERLTLETALRRALERDQFSLHYQPKVEMGDQADHRRRGSVALGASRSRRAAAHAIHTARRRDRADRSDRLLGLEGSLRTERGLAAPRIAADIDSGQSLAKAVRRRAAVAGYRRGAGGKRHVAGTAAA
jgi:diguanylate cyclase (GGDEF)-like protein